MNEPQVFEALASRYRQDGYQVIAHPDARDLPAHLADTPPTLLASDGNRIIAWFDRPDSGLETEPIESGAEFGREAAVALITEAQRLLNPFTLRSAVIVAWSAFEATARSILQTGRAALADVPTPQLMALLVEEKLIPDEECEPLRRALIIRNIVIHGGLPDDLPPELIPSVLAITRRLLDRDRDDSPLLIDTQSKTTASRSFVGQPDLGELTEGATKVLTHILSRWQTDVLAQWNWAEAGRGRPVVLLRLSDVTAAVSAVFEPAELADLAMVEDRLRWLWGDLLEIRSHRELDRISKWSTTPAATIPA